MTKNPWFKIVIGLTAGLCAAIFPRLVAALTAAGDPGTVTLFNAYDVLLSLVFAAMLGLSASQLATSQSSKKKGEAKRL